MKPEYDIDCWYVIGDKNKVLIGVSTRYVGTTYKNTIRTSRIIGRRGNKVETKNSIYNLLNCAILSDKEEMLKDIKELENA